MTVPGVTKQPDALEPETAAPGDFGCDDVVHALTTPEFRQDPYALYAQMRRERPVFRSTQGNWYLTRYVDVEAALGDLRLSNDRDRMTAAFAARQGPLQRMSRLTQRLGRVMTNTDPPEHTRLRRLVSKAFTVRRVEDLRPRIEAAVEGLLDTAFAQASTMDVIASLASPLPATVMCELFGVPEDDRNRVRAWIRQISDTRSADGFTQLELSIERLEDYLADLIARHRARPADDIIGALIAAQERGDELTDDELLSTCFTLLSAGFETTTNLIGNGVLALLRHPDQLRRLQQDPMLVHSAVQELLRFDTPGQMTIRVAAQATEIGGQAVDAGNLVYLVLASTNRDPDRFVDPDRLDLGRPDARQLSFGAGPHFCLGAPLARLEAEVAIGALISRQPTLRLDTKTVQWRPNPLQRGVISLPVAYT